MQLFSLKTRFYLTFTLMILVAMSTHSVQSARWDKDQDNLAIDTIVRKVMKTYNLPGLSLAIVEGDQISYSAGYGKADTSGRTFSSQTPITIGSVSKSFTALAILQQVERGKIRLDEPVVTYLPWFHTSQKSRSDQITIRQLLNQTSGFSNAIGLQPVYDRQPGFSLERRLGDLAKVDLSRPAGSQYEYSNTNYLLLGAVVEAVSRLNFADYLEQNIFSPLAMKNSSARLADAQQKDMAAGYYWWFGFPFSSGTPWYQDSVPAGYILSTADDMGNYMIAQLNGGTYSGISVLSPEGIAEMQYGAVSTGNGQSYGMGWVEGQVGNLTAVSYEGDAAGYTTTVILDPERKIGVAVLANASSMLVSPTHALATQVFQTLHGQSISEPGLTTTSLYLIVDFMVLGLTIWMILAYLYLPRWWKRLGEWRKAGAGTRLVKIFIPIVLDLLWPYLLLGFIPQGAGFPMWRVLNVFQPDLSYWLQVFAWAAVTKGVVKMSLFFIFIRTHKPASLTRMFRRGST